MNRLLPSIVIVLAVLLGTGCTTTQIVGQLSTQPADKFIRPGDQVDCKLRDGTRVVFKVVKIEDGVIVGEKHRVAANEIIRLEIKRFSATKTAWAVVGVAAGIALGVGISNFAAMPSTAP